MPTTPSTSCSRCGAPTVRIGLLDSSARLTMQSCSNCDHRVWLRDGVPTRLGAVLDSVAQTGRRKSA
jgi:DNA-directed RNA polymerase subunit RPC12/RpoP